MGSQWESYRAMASDTRDWVLYGYSPLRPTYEEDEAGPTPLAPKDPSGSNSDDEDFEYYPAPVPMPLFPEDAETAAPPPARQESSSDRSAADGDDGEDQKDKKKEDSPYMKDLDDFELPRTFGGKKKH
jgi:hypothetical protein